MAGKPWDADPVVTMPQAAAPAAPAAPAPVQAPQAPTAGAKPWEADPVVGQSPQQPAGKVGKFESFFTGEGRLEHPDMPNLEELNMPLGRLLASAGIVAATDTKQKVDILKAHLPGATFANDAYGNPMVTYNGQTVYVAKPGLRTGDVLQAGAQGTAYALGLGALGKAGAIASKIPGVGAIGQIVKGIPVVGRFAAPATAAAGTSAALDLAAHAGGAETVIDAPRAAGAGLVGVGAEVLSPVANSAYRWLSGVFQSKPFVDAAGNLSQEAEVLLHRAGINPAAISGEFKQWFSKLARDAVDPGDVTKAAQAQALPVPVPQTRGNVSGLASDQMTESLAAKGAYGPDAENTMRGVMSRQQDALRGNVEAIQGRLGGQGAPQVVEKGQGGAKAQNALVEAQGRTKAATSAAYGEAEKAPALVTTSGTQGLAAEVMKPAEKYGVGAPIARQQADRLANLSLSERDAMPVKALFDWRRQTSELAANAPSAAEGAALKEQLRAFDGQIESTVKSALMSGDEESAGKWLRAIAIRRGEGRRFQSNDLIADLLETENAGGGARLKIAPEQASNYIFGAANLGFITKPQLARDLGRLRARLGPDSDAWNALREEAWLRFAKAGEGPMQGADRAFSGTNFKKAWDAGWRDNGPTMRVLFGEQERKLIDTFAEVAARTTGKVAGGDNPSGTAVALSNIAQKLARLPMFGEKAALLLQPIVGATVKLNQRMQLGRNLAEPVELRALPKGAFPGAALGVYGATANDGR